MVSAKILIQLGTFSIGRTQAKATLPRKHLLPCPNFSDQDCLQTVWLKTLFCHLPGWYLLHHQQRHDPRKMDSPGSSHLSDLLTEVRCLVLWDPPLWGVYVWAVSVWRWVTDILHSDGSAGFLNLWHLTLHELRAWSRDVWCEGGCSHPSSPVSFKKCYCHHMRLQVLTTSWAVSACSPHAASSNRPIFNVMFRDSWLVSHTLNV